MKIDRELAQKHLSYLRYKLGEADLRFFYHSWDDRKNKDKGRKESQCNWTQIEEYQKNGRGGLRRCQWCIGRTHRCQNQTVLCNFL